MAASTQTQTVTKGAGNNRLHDYIYDPVFQVSSQRDHAKIAFDSTTTGRIKQIPIYNNMFSELRYAPRFAMQMDRCDPVPQHMNKSWNNAISDGGGNTRSQPYSGVANGRQADVSGRDRALHFRRPVIPFTQNMSGGYVMDNKRDLGGVSGAKRARNLGVIDSGVRSVHTQTDYRDGEAQTDPYTPEYVVKPGEQPEALTLASLAYGKGLPAGLAEVEMIERAREKRLWEASLPPLGDIEQQDKRERMMDQMEMKEWNIREQQIAKVQQARLNVLLRLLKEREEKQHDLNTKRLDKVWRQRQTDKERRVAKVRHEYLREVRKLVKSYEHPLKISCRMPSRNIADDYKNNGSSVFAPLTRNGVFFDKYADRFQVKNKFLSTVDGIRDLEESLPKYVMNLRVKAPKRDTNTKKGFVKRSRRDELMLEALHTDILKNKDNALGEDARQLRYLQLVEKPQPRPPTPTAQGQTEEDEDLELSLITIQKLMRGRAVQQQWFNARERRQTLIDELRSTHALQAAEKEMTDLQRENTFALQCDKLNEDMNQEFINECLDDTAGQSMGDMFDFLSKELIRLQEERRIHGFAMLAERERRMREAEESGHRQMQERRRREWDEMFKQITKVHQETAALAMADIVADATESTAAEKSEAHVRELAAKINDIAHATEEKRSELESEEIVSEMVHDFLMPHVNKKAREEQLNLKTRKFLVAAHKTINDETNEKVKKA